MKALFVRVFSLVALMMPSVESWAFFEFQPVSMPAFNVPAGQGNPTIIISVTFKAFCNSGCTGQDYRMALSDENPGTISPIGSGVQPPLEYKADNLKGFLVSAEFTQSTNSGFLTAGQWSHPTGSASYFKTVTNADVTGQLKLTLNRDELDELGTGTTNLEFYIAGQDMYGTLHLDSTLITIPLVVQEVVQISGLEDVELNARDEVGGFIESSFGACLYSNTGEVTISLDGANDSLRTGAFYLDRGAECQVWPSWDGCVFYELGLSDDNGNSWVSYKREGENLGELFSASAKPGCSSQDNLVIRVRVESRNLPSDTGVYSDTMTLTVSPD